MKVEQIHTEKMFKPITIQITFESQEELNKFGALCNFKPLTLAVSLPSYGFMEAIGASISTDELLRDLMNDSYMASHYRKI